MEEKYSEPFSRLSEELDIAAYAHKFFLALVPNWIKVFGPGPFDNESDGFDARGFLRLYFEVKESKKWVEIR